MVALTPPGHVEAVRVGMSTGENRILGATNAQIRGRVAPALLGGGLDRAEGRGASYSACVSVGPKDPRVDFVFLAREVGPAFPGGNLVNVRELGLYDILLLGSLPADIGVVIVGRLQWRAEDADKQFRITYAVRAFNSQSPQPTLLDSAPVTVEAEPSPYPHHESGFYPAQILSHLIVRLTGYGSYVADVLLDGTVIASEPFAVITPGSTLSSTAVERGR